MDPAAMRARDVMTPAVVTVGPDASVGEVADILIVHRISAVPVVDASGLLVGIVSESDFLRRIDDHPSGSWWLRLFTSAADEARAYVKAHGRKVGEVMTKDVVTVPPDALLGEVAHLLETRGVKRVPVVTGGRLVGIVSRADIVRALAARRATLTPTAPPSDKTIRDAVIAAIEEFDWGTPARVSVSVANGAVTIYGLLDHEAQRDALQVAAENVPGVTSVEVHARPFLAKALAD